MALVWGDSNENPEPEPCHECGGKGWFGISWHEPYESRENCERCGGTGKEPVTGER